MKIAIISDIHSNIEALKEARSIIKDRGVDEIICLGDIVGYGPDPKRCIEVVKDFSTLNVCGNHDYGVVGKTDISLFVDYAINAIKWTRSRLDKEEINFISDLPYTEEYNDLFLVHSSPVNPPSWEYILGKPSAKRAFNNFGQELCFIGHSHRPMMWGERESSSLPPSNREVQLEPERRYIINVGSVGQPRDGDNRGCFVIYNDSNKTIQFQRFEYAYKKTQRKIIDAGLPPLLSERLELGK